MKERQYKMKVTKILYLLGLGLIVGACSKVPIVKDIDIGEAFDEDIEPPDIIGKAIPKWFQGNPEFVLENSGTEQTVHMFFDMEPEIDYRNFDLDFVALTPQGSKFEYDLDLLSGQHFSNRSYCQQDDIWKSYKEVIYKPPFTIGVVPKVLDELGKPQKVIVFGEEDYIQENFLSNVFDARIIGGIIEQNCPQGGCFKLDEWERRLVLVGVQADYSRYENIKSIKELQKKVDWARAKSFLENGQGRNKISSNYYPAFRMGAILDASKSMEYMKKNSIFLKPSKLYGIKKSCQKLYSTIWKNVGLDSKYEVDLKSLKTKEERRDYIQKNKLTKNSLFYHRFKNAFVKYNNSYKTCIKYIYPSNINHNREKHWFFAYYSAIHHLHELGFSFDCRRGIWSDNPVLNSGKKAIILKDEFKYCNAKKIDTAFEQAITYLNILRKKKLNTYRYIDYDNNSLGTHNKLYSWVPIDNKHFQCKKRDIPDITKRFEAFPEDVNWRRRRLRINNDGRIVE